MSMAPIVLFVYNRPSETRLILDSLKKNALAIQSQLFVFSDAARTKSDYEAVEQVREIIRNIEGFKDINIFESKKNHGLANAIINGVDQILTLFDKVIVLEDDLICSNDFIEYMNESLKKYEQDPRIWSISGYSPSLKFPEDYDKSIYLSTRACSWGWATWKDRWEMSNWNLSDFENIKSNRSLQKKFNRGGNDLFKLLELQHLKKIDSWAIRWCYSQFKRHMFTIYPRQSKIKNLGFSKNATHTKSNDRRWNVTLNHDPIIFPSEISYVSEIGYNFKNFYDLDWIGKIGFFLKKYGLYNFARTFKSIFRS